MFQENQQIGYYTLIHFLGRGGFGEVWLAEKRNVMPPERVAIKLPHDEQLDLGAVKDEIFNWILSGKHKNILPIIECETFGNQVAIVSEYAPDGSLRDLLQKRGKLTAAEAAQMMVGILEGLAHLHGRKIIHRDLKPENILLSGNIPRLTDFGISRAIAEGNSTSVILGTQAFMAPESFDGKRTAQTDIWSVGVIFYLLTTGQLPFPQREITALVGAIVMQNPPPLPDTVPVELQNIIGRALAKDAAFRYQSAAEMLQDFDRKYSVQTNSLGTIPFDLDTHPGAAILTPVQQQAATQVLTAPVARKSKTAFFIVLGLLIIISFGGALAYGGYQLVQTIRRDQTVSSNNTNSPGGINNYPLTERTVSEFSVDLIDEALAGVEKKSAGKVRLTRFLLSRDDGKFILAVFTVKDADNPDYYDTYTYYFANRMLNKRALKDPPFFDKTGGKWFYKEDVNWAAIPELRQKIAAKAAEIGESDGEQMITVTRKFVSFTPETYGDIIFDIKNSGTRKDVKLNADATGEQVELKVD